MSMLSPRLWYFLTAALAGLFMAGCQSGTEQATTNTVKVAAKQECAHIQNSRQRARCEEDTGGAGGGQAAGWDDEQRANAKLIADVGREMNIPHRGQVVAIATAIQESKLRNDACCDHDSLGLFQQRPSQGWGTSSQVTDPRYAARTFYQHLVAVPNWQTIPLWQAAQAVQVSCCPLAYAQWERAALTLAA